MATNYRDEWHDLVGRVVEVRLNGRHIRTAEVEEVTHDSAFLWLRFYGADPRQLIAKSDDYTITPIAQNEVPGSLPGRAVT